MRCVESPENSKHSRLVERAQAIWSVNDLDAVDYVLLLPHEDLRLNTALRADFAEKLGSRRGMVIDGERAESLLELYSLYEFTGKLIIGSFDLPYGRKLRNLLNSGVATEEELISDVILGAMDGTAAQ